MAHHKKAHGHHTGEISRHHMHGPKGKDKMAHPSHHKMNKAHGTPDGFHAEQCYEGPSGGGYSGAEGPGVPSMTGNEMHESGSDGGYD